VPTPPEFISPFIEVTTEEPVKTFSEHLTLRHASAPEKLIHPDPFYAEVHLHPNDHHPHTQQDLREIMKIVLHEIHVVPDGDYFYNGNFVLSYIVYPLRNTLAEVQSQNLGRQLAWEARMMRKNELASALMRAFIDLFPCGPPTPSVPADDHMARGAFRPHQSLPLEMDVASSPYMDVSYMERSSSNSSAFQNLVQPAVTHLVSKTKKKRAKGLPNDYRARQNLVEEKHNNALTMLRPYLLDESQEKIYLRGDNVAFIQVKSPPALRVVDDFLGQILNDESIQIEQCTVPISRKRQGQKKGFLVYLQCKTAANVARIFEIFEKDFEKSGLKCKTALFEKNLNNSSESSLETEV